MIPHRNPSFLIAKSSPKQIKTPGSPPGVFIWGQPSAAGVTPHCAGAASPRRNLSEPGLISPKRFREILRSRTFRSIRSRYELPGTAVSSGRFPPPLCPPDTSTHAKRPHTRAVTHRYKKWTMGNRNGSKEARRYSPGLLYCYRFSITTPPGSAGERKKPYLQVSNKARKG